MGRIPHGLPLPHSDNFIGEGASSNAQVHGPSRIPLRVSRGDAALHAPTVCDTILPISRPTHPSGALRVPQGVVCLVQTPLADSGRRIVGAADGDRLSGTCVSAKLPIAIPRSVWIRAASPLGHGRRAPTLVTHCLIQLLAMATSTSIGTQVT